MNSVKSIVISEINVMRKVMIFGTFDIVHAGHIEFFKQVKRLGKNLVVVVGRDTTVKRIKGHSPFNNERARVEFLKHIDYIDTVMLGDAKDVYTAVAKVKPDVIALGYDQKDFVDGLNEYLKKTKKHIRVVRLKPYKSGRYKTGKIKRYLGIV